MWKSKKDWADSHSQAKDLKAYHSVEEAVQRIKEIYERSCQEIQRAFGQFAVTGLKNLSLTEANYPYVGVNIDPAEYQVVDARYSYAIVDAPGSYGTTVTRPDLFEEYYLRQIRCLIENYKQPILVGTSDWPIPLPFVLDHSTSDLTAQQIEEIKFGFVLPNLTRVNDKVVNHTHATDLNGIRPLALFSGERVDFSLNRLHHYTGTDPVHFQNFILLTNYQRYTEAFRQYAIEQVQKGEIYTALVEPGDHIVNEGISLHETNVAHLSQMPAYHLKRPDKNGITFINIGVGSTNAKTITDHLAVLRPHCWIMLGHCAGLRASQMLGDYVLPHGYVREDHVLDQDLPTWVPIPPIAEIQIALQQAIVDVTGLKEGEFKSRTRTGTVFTTDNRHWELRSDELYERFNQSRAIALDMESATIAANGLRFRVPYGTLLCVSDKPIHGEIKLRGMANKFYRERVSQHLQVGLRTIEIIRQRGIDSLHSRKLRGFDEPPFR